MQKSRGVHRSIVRAAGRRCRIVAGMACFLFALHAASAMAQPALSNAAPLVLRIPGGAGGLGFDDLGYSRALGRILVPAAGSGNLVLINPADDRMRVLRRVVPPARGTVGSHDAGTTSASFGGGLLFASDHPQQQLLAVSPRTGAVVARIDLASQPDYVRWVGPLRQVWVTEPHARQIERFAVTGGPVPSFRRVGVVAVPHGPESLVIDRANGMAYANHWQGETVEIPLRDPHVARVMPNSCKGSRGLALDPADQTLFVGCAEGKVVALDLVHRGAIISSAPVGKGVDIIAWNPALRHVYAPGSRVATLSVLGYNGAQLQLLRTLPAAIGSHCVATDGHAKVYVCDPRAGTILVYRDPPGALPRQRMDRPQA